MVTKKQLRERIAALELKFEQERLKTETERKELSQRLDEVLETTRRAAKAPTAEEVLEEWFNGAEKTR